MKDKLKRSLNKTFAILHRAHGRTKKDHKVSGLNSEACASVLVALITLIFVKANQRYAFNAELAQNQPKVNVTELC